MITLESVLNGEYTAGNNAAYNGEDLDILQAECFEILADMSEIHGNLQTFEAGKLYRKAKAKKKKVKVKKTKTRAKNVKKTGKKVRREEDDVEEDLKEGIDAAGAPVGRDLTESEVEALPDNAHVTEVEPQGEEEDTEEISTTSESYIIQFESYAMDEIIRMEAEQKKEQNKFIAKIKELWEKFVKFVSGLWQKVKDWANQDRRLLDKAGNDLDKKLQDTEKKISVRVCKDNPVKIIDEAKNAFAELMKGLGTSDKMVYPQIYGGVSLEKLDGSLTEALYEKIFGEKEPKAKEVTIKEAAANLGGKSEITKFLLEIPKAFDQCHSDLKKSKGEIEKAIKADENVAKSDRLNLVREKFKLSVKVMGFMRSFHKDVRSDIRKIVAAAAGVSLKDEEKK